MAKSSPKEKTLPSSIKCLQPVKTYYGSPVFADNPFLEAFSIMVRRKSEVIASGLRLMDCEDEEVSAATVARVKEVDTNQFVKLFTDNIGLMFDLSPAAIKVLTVLVLEIQATSKDQAEVYFSYAQIEAYCQTSGKSISKATFSRGLSELIEAKFIAKSARGSSWFWTNPGVLFNGDRVRFINEYRIKRKQERLEESGKALSKKESC